jgi:hypothetical protein
MKRQIILKTLIIAIIISLSGCIETNNNNNNNVNNEKELEIINYNVITEAYSYNTNWTTYGEGFNPDLLPEIVYNDAGIYRPEEFTKARYRINGTAKNNGSHTINQAIINLNFYNNNNTFLTLKQLKNFSKLKTEETWNFTYEYNHNYDYFMDINYLEITTGLPPKDFIIPDI